MEELEEEGVVIVGAGIAGLATAVAFHRVGIQALVIERSEELRTTGAAIALFSNAWPALDALGVAHKLTSLYAPSNKAFITNIRNREILEVSMAGPERDGYGPITVHRKVLLEALAEEIPASRIRFSSKLTYIEATLQNDGSSSYILHFQIGTPVKTKVLIGCDGVHSVVARWLGLAAPVGSGRLAGRGRAVFPRGHGFTQDYRQFIDVGVRGGFVRLNYNELYWFLFTTKPVSKEMASRDKETIQREITDNIAKNFPSIYLDVIRHTDLSTLTWAPVMFRLPWDILFGNLCKGTVTVAGDAMHPMTPELGQGSASALEDAVVLGRRIGESVIQRGKIVPEDVAKAIGMYVGERRRPVAWRTSSSFLAGWLQLQQVDSGWWMKFLRDVIFYKFLYTLVFNSAKYDCGKLPKTD